MTDNELLDRDGSSKLARTQRIVRQRLGREMSLEEAQEVVYAFTDFMADHYKPLLLDAEALPYPKEVIYAAFFLRIREYERLREINPSLFSKQGHDKELEWMCSGPTYISDYQNIDPEDKQFIEDAKASGLTDFSALRRPCQMSAKVLLMRSGKYLHRGIDEYHRMCQSYDF